MFDFGFLEFIIKDRRMEFGAAKAHIYAFDTNASEKSIRFSTTQILAIIYIQSNQPAIEQGIWTQIPSEERGGVVPYYRVWLL